MVRCRKQHKGKEKVVRARGKRMHRARTAWCTARTALTSPSLPVLHDPPPPPPACGDVFCPPLPPSEKAASFFNEWMLHPHPQATLPWLFCLNPAPCPAPPPRQSLIRGRHLCFGTAHFPQREYVARRALVPHRSQSGPRWRIMDYGFGVSPRDIPGGCHGPAASGGALCVAGDWFGRPASGGAEKWVVSFQPRERAPGALGKVFPRFGVAPQFGVKDFHASVWPLEWSVTHKRGIL